MTRDERIEKAAGRLMGIADMLGVRRPIPLLKNVTVAPPTGGRVVPPGPGRPVTTMLPDGGGAGARVVGGRAAPPQDVRAGLQHVTSYMDGRRTVAGLQFRVGQTPIAATRAGAVPAVRRHEVTHALIDSGRLPPNAPWLWRQAARYGEAPNGTFRNDVGRMLHETAAHAAEGRTPLRRAFGAARFWLNPGKVYAYTPNMRTWRGRAAYAAPSAAVYAGAGVVGHVGARALKPAPAPETAAAPPLLGSRP